MARCAKGKCERCPHPCDDHEITIVAGVLVLTECRREGCHCDRD